MSNAVRLELGVTADTDAAAAAFDKVGQSARDMADDVDAAARDADSGMSGFGGSAEAAGSSAQTAAGAFGDLGGALAMIPGPLGQLGAGMETAAPAIQGVTGATDLLSLAQESQVLKMVAAYGKTVALTAVQKVAATATKVWTGIQWAFNAAMEANPIGLVVVAIGLLIGLTVLAYKKSDTFRGIIDKLGATAKTVFSSIVGWIQRVVGWVRDKLGPVFTTYATIVRTEIGIVVGIVRGLLGVVKTVSTGIWNALSGAWDKVKGLFKWDPGPTLKKAWDSVKGILTKPFTDAWGVITGIFGPDGKVTTIGGAMVGAVKTAINDVIDLINKLINAFNKLPGPDIPNVSPVSAAAAGGAAGVAAVSRMGVAARGPTSTRAAAGGVTINIYGAIDTYATAQQIRRVLARGSIIAGRPI